MRQIKKRSKGGVVWRVTLLTLTILLLLDLIRPLHTNAETTKCSDKALAIYEDCLTVEEELIEMYYDLDLYSDWEVQNLTNRYQKCESFKQKESRYADCVGRHTFGDKWYKMFPE